MPASGGCKRPCLPNLNPSRPQERPPRKKRARSSTLRVIGWFSVGMAVAAFGIYLGLPSCASRYKFKRRTPYDFYSNAGD
jgi:hypothetical protein